MVIALVMLLVLTLLATASARMTLMEERMTGNTQDRNVAFQAAEAALRSGEAQAPGRVLPDFGGATRWPLHACRSWRRPGLGCRGLDGC